MAWQTVDHMPQQPYQPLHRTVAGLVKQGWQVTSWNSLTVVLTKQPRQSGALADVVLTILTFGLYLPVLLANALLRTRKPKQLIVTVDRWGQVIVR